MTLSPSTHSYDMMALCAAREGERYELHSKYLNEMWVRVLKTLGNDVGFVRGVGPYLYDRDGARYLDLLSAWGVFALGRNHPKIRDALASVIMGESANLAALDVSVLAGVLAEMLLKRVPFLDKAFFANSGTEAVEAAIKFARAATGRPYIAHCAHAFHGLTYGALAMNGDEIFKKGFEPHLPNTR
ncbi:MAG TPA: aminotransferase class III-fold pyridoxal phosphate-dependent enzyme, partial [Methylocystis sp.]|nr:aminotransferase class III-fold pyridoxal phosphate-dependent enzyme [Methylocystis sp.]